MMFVAGEFLHYGGFHQTHFYLATLLFMGWGVSYNVLKPDFMVFLWCYIFIHYFFPVLLNILLCSHTAAFFLGHIIISVAAKYFYQDQTFMACRLLDYGLFPSPNTSAFHPVCGKTCCRLVLNVCLHLFVLKTNT